MWVEKENVNNLRNTTEDADKSPAAPCLLLPKFVSNMVVFIRGVIDTKA